MKLIKLSDFDLSKHRFEYYRSNRGSWLFEPQLSLYASEIGSYIDAQNVIGLLKSIVEEDSEARVRFNRSDGSGFYANRLGWRLYRLKNIRLMVSLRCPMCGKVSNLGAEGICFVCFQNPTIKQNWRLKRIN